MRYEYRVTSDSEDVSDGAFKERNELPDLLNMLYHANARMMCDASWAEVQFVRVDDDGTHEVLRRLRLD